MNLSEKASDLKEEEEENKYTLGNDVNIFFDNLFNRGGKFGKDNRYWKIPSQDSNQELHTLKIIGSKLSTFPEQEFKIPPATENEECCAFYVPGIKENNSLLLPGPSSLDRKEQFRLYFYQTRTFYKNKTLNESETADFKMLLEKSNRDYPAFQSFVQKQWITQQFKRTLQIPPTVQLYIDHLWHTKARKCVDLYPHNYKSIGNIPLALNDPNKDWTVLEPCKMIVKKGAPVKITMPKLKTPCLLLTEYSDLCKIKPVSVDPASRKEPISCHSQPTSFDLNVNRCLEQNEIDVVITSSGIKSIVDIDTFSKDWILPITVRNVLLQDGKTSKKVVIVDKKLPPSHMSVHDKNIWHAKIATRWALILNNAPHLLENDQEERSSAFNDRQLTVYDDLMTQEHETSGICLKPQNKSGQRQDFGLKKTSLNSILQNSPAVSDVESDESEILDIRTFMETSECRHPLSSVGVKEHISEQKKFTTQISNPPSKKIKNTSYKVKPCSHYMLWKLHKNKHVHMLKQEQRTLNILVRTRNDGKLIYFDQNICNVVQEEVNISSKLEMQPEYGASRMTKSELVREYVDLYLRPSSKLIRVRTVGHTKELMLNEIKKISEIRTALQAMQVETQKIFDPLYSVLTKLIDVPVGKYLLEHSAKMGAFTHLMTEDPKGANFSLLNYCCELKSCDVCVPATQVDRFVLTRLHNREKIPPAVLKAPLFRPSGNLSRKSNKPSTVVKKDKDKKKKKKKKKSPVKIQ